MRPHLSVYGAPNSISGNSKRSRRLAARLLASPLYVLSVDVPCSPQEAGGMGSLTGRCDPSPVDPRKETFEGQELRHLAAIRLTLWNAQHVQGVP